MSAADWYQDPTREGRLRYWDGSSWTEHVSEGGAVASDPIQGIAPAPPLGAGASAAVAASGAQPAATVGTAEVSGGGGATGATAPGAAWLTGSRPGGPTILGRAGFGVAAVGGILAALSAGKVAVEQTEPFNVTISVGGGSWLGIVAAVICLGGALSPWLWGRTTAAVLAWLFGTLIAFAVIGFRTDDIFLTGPNAGDVSLGTAGWLMALGAILLFVGTALALWGIRRPVQDVDERAVQNPREGKAVASLVCGIVGLLIIIPAPAAVSLALGAFDDDRASGGKVGYRGMAVAGLVMGIVALALWGIGLTLAMFFTQP